MRSTSAAYQSQARAQAHYLTHLGRPIDPEKVIPWARLGIPETFRSAAQAFSELEDLNEETIGEIAREDGDERIDELRDWMKSHHVETGSKWKRVGSDWVPNEHRKSVRFADTPRGRQILEAAKGRGMAHGRVFAELLTYLLGQAEGRRWDRVPWADVESLVEAFTGTPVSLNTPLSSGLYSAEEVFASIDDVRPAAAPELARQINSRVLYHLAERLQRMIDPDPGPDRRATRQRWSALPAAIRRTVERRLSTLLRWAAHPELVPDYVCDATRDPSGYLCTFSAIRSDVRELEAALSASGSATSYSAGVRAAIDDTFIPAHDYAPDEAIPF